MRLKHLIFLITYLFLSNCKNNELIDQSLEKRIISLIVNEIAIPLPPPPPPSPGEVGASLSKKTIDSINSIKLKVGLNPRFLQFDSLQLKTESYPSDFVNLIEDIQLQKPKVISNESLDKISRHNLKFTSLEGKDEIEDFDLVVSISNIVWSKDKDKAVAIATRKLGKFNGTTYLFLFERNIPKEKIKIYQKYVILKS